MELRPAPSTFLIAALIAALLMAVASIRIATQQPWLGLQVKADADAVMIRAAAADSPFAESVGSRLIRIETTGTPGLALTADDVIEEPDMLADPARLRRFFDRRAQLDAVLQAPTVSLVVAGTDGATRTFTAPPAPRRPVSDLPLPFWTQLLVGGIGLTVGAWVVTLRPRDMAAWMVAVTGIGLALASQSAAIYSTRELALNATTFGIISRLNGFGTLLFGIGLVTLFLIYPKRLVPRVALALPAAVIGAAMVVMLFVNWPDHVPLLQPAVAAIMAVLLAAILAQTWANRRDPVARAMIGWLGLSVVLGAGGFVTTVILPPLLGKTAVVAQSTAFLLFLIIYLGLALGVARYRLFDLADWAFGSLFYAIGVALLLMLDAALIYGLAIDRLPALSLSLALICLTYLPLRDRVAVWHRRGADLPIEELYRRISLISHQPDTAGQVEAIKTLWSDIFKPLSISALPVAPPPVASRAAAPPRLPTLAEDGRTLFLPARAAFPAFRLDFAAQGARLFSTRDLRQAATLCDLLEDTLLRQRAYAQAVEAERSRINRDMHDNIGIQLLSALHSAAPERKNVLIRQAMADLREIVANPTRAPRDLMHVLADLRAELGDALAAAGLELDWQATELAGQEIPLQLAQTLRAVLREGVSNILRHSGARTAQVIIDVADDQVSVVLRDDGRGFDPAVVANGSGLENLRIRLENASGDFSVASSDRGTVVTSTLPLRPRPARAAE